MRSKIVLHTHCDIYCSLIFVVEKDLAILLVDSQVRSGAFVADSLYCAAGIYRSGGRPSVIRYRYQGIATMGYSDTGCLHPAESDDG